MIFNPGGITFNNAWDSCGKILRLVLGFKINFSFTEFNTMFNSFNPNSETKQLDQQQNTTAPDQQWQKWVGKVLGSEDDIKNALKELNREPKDTDELQTAIFAVRKREIEETARESAETGYDFPD